MRTAIFICLTLCTGYASAATSSIEDCKKAAQAQIDKIDERMTKGYSAREGERFKKQRSQAVTVRRECAKDPNAWRKLVAFYG